MDTLYNDLLLLLATVAQLIAVTLGIAVIYGLMRVINFAHGEFITMGRLRGSAAERGSRQLFG